MKENIEQLNEFSLVTPAKDLLVAITDSADALSKQPLTEERMKSMKLVLGFLNAYVRSFQVKTGYIRLVGTPEKLEAIKKNLTKK